MSFLTKPVFYSLAMVVGRQDPGVLFIFLHYLRRYFSLQRFVVGFC